MKGKTNKLMRVQEFAELLDMDEWLINPYFSALDGVDFMAQEGVDELAQAVDSFTTAGVHILAVDGQHQLLATTQRLGFTEVIPGAASVVAVIWPMSSSGKNPLGLFANK